MKEETLVFIFIFVLLLLLHWRLKVKAVRKGKEIIEQLEALEEKLREEG